MERPSFLKNITCVVHKIILSLVILSQIHLLLYSPSLLLVEINSNNNLEKPDSLFLNSNAIINNSSNMVFQKQYFSVDLDSLIHNSLSYYLNYHGNVIRFQNSSILVKGVDQFTKSNFYINFTFYNSNNVEPEGREASSYSVNYFTKNRNMVHTFDFSEIWYSNLYNNIDLVYYMSSQGLKYDFIVQPGANPNDITFSVTTNLSTSLNTDSIVFYGNDLTNTPVFSDDGLFSYQNGNEIVQTNFELKSNMNCLFCYGFAINQYNTFENLIIDPYWLVFNENVDLNESSNYKKANSFAFDSKGNMFVAGTFSLDYIEHDIFLAKYTSSGEFVSKLILGGSSNDYLDFDEDYRSTFKSLAIDANDNIFITGYTTSGDFPVKNAYQNTTGGGEEAFIMKLTTNLDVLISTFLGGSGNDRGRSIAIYQNDIFVSGLTDSDDFPVKDALQPVFNGGELDSFISKYDLNLNVVFSSYFGGDVDDQILGMAVDNSGNIVLTGETTSYNFSITGLAIQPNHNDHPNPDAFIAKMSKNGSEILFNTYFGGDSWDIGNDVLVDSNNDILVIGSSSSTSTTLILPPTKQYASGSLFNSRMFLLKLNDLGYIPEEFITFGGDGNNYGLSLALDQSDNIYIGGNTFSNNFWKGVDVHVPETSNNTRAFVTKLLSPNYNLDLSSIVDSECVYHSCTFIATQIALGLNDSLYLLGHDRYADKNITPDHYNWKPFLMEISKTSDITPPVITFPGYQLDKIYSPKSFVNITVQDDSSGVDKFYYRWGDNGSIIELPAPYSIVIPETQGSQILYIEAVDKAGNSNDKSYTVTIKGEDFTSLITAISLVALSVVSGYLTIYFAWKYYFSKIRERRQLESKDIKEYIDMVQKSSTLLEEDKKV